MSDFTIKNLKEDVENAAPSFGIQGLEFRSASAALDCTQTGLSYQRYEPGFRTPFGHTHDAQEEVYVVVGGSGRISLGDEVAELRQWDAVRVPPETMRALEAGLEGLELLAFGAPRTGPGDAEMVQDWWPES
jgi:mannose-6-phosphate isomerase-like protein (cupin superfamily)